MLIFHLLLFVNHLDALFELLDTQFSYYYFDIMDNLRN